jgi:hypothetical protein
MAAERSGYCGLTKFNAQAPIRARYYRLYSVGKDIEYDTGPLEPSAYCQKCSFHAFYVHDIAIMGEILNDISNIESRGVLYGDRIQPGRNDRYNEIIAKTCIVVRRFDCNRRFFYSVKREFIRKSNYNQNIQLYKKKN